MHFVVFAACMCGKSITAFKYAKLLTKFVFDRLSEQNAVSTFMCESFLMIEPMVYVRFGRWREILNFSIYEDMPNVLKLFTIYAKCIACAALNMINESLKFKTDFLIVLSQVQAKTVLHNEKIHNIAKVAINIMNAEILYRQENEDWKQHMKEAVANENELAYDEPPAWMMPTRQTFGALLLESGDKDNAMQKFEEDLEKWPENVWSGPSYYNLKANKIKSIADESINCACACATTMI